MKRKEFYLAIVYYKDGSEKEIFATKKEMLDIKIDIIIGSDKDKVKVVNVFHVNKIEEITYESEEGEGNANNN